MKKQYENKDLRYIPISALCFLIEEDIVDLYEDVKNSKYSQAEKIIIIKEIQEKLKILKYKCRGLS